MRAGYIDANSETYNCTKWKLNYTGAWAALSTSDFVFSSAYSNVHSSTFGQTWSTFQHIGFPTLRSAEELEDTRLVMIE